MSEWKEHDGGSQPKETMGRRVEYELRDGYRDVIMADEIHWSWTRTPIPQYAQILRYRLLDTPSSEEVDDGGPAFPCEGGDLSGLYAAPGMTFRAWAAGMAMQGMHASMGSWPDSENIKEIATLSVEQADALLAALAARKEK